MEDTDNNLENFDEKEPNKFLGILKTILVWTLIILVCRELFTNTKEDAFITAPYYKEPEQVLLSPAEKEKFNIIVKEKNTKAVIKPQASYKISARVIAKTHILEDGVSELVPYDIGLVWGDLMKNKAYRKLDILQYQRWIMFRITEKNKKFFPNPDYIPKHIANNHLIPANKNILKGIKKLKKYDKVYIEGYLVYCDITYKKSPFFAYNSSLSRDDSGDHACEIFYVTKLISPRGSWQ